MYLNVNRFQNKFAEVGSDARVYKAQVMPLTETKIDASYSKSQFKLDWYNIRAKGGGRVMAYFFSIETHRLKN